MRAHRSLSRGAPGRFLKSIWCAAFHATMELSNPVTSKDLPRKRYGTLCTRSLNDCTFHAAATAGARVLFIIMEQRCQMK